MEGVLDVYERPADPARPVVCLDETSRQLLADARPPLPPVPGHLARHDPEYVRGGVANVFLVTEPLRGWRAGLVGKQRARLDFAAYVKERRDVPTPTPSGWCWCWTNSTQITRDGPLGRVCKAPCVGACALAAPSRPRTYGSCERRAEIPRWTQ